MKESVKDFIRDYLILIHRRVGAKTVPRNHANKNKPHKNNDVPLFSSIKSIINITKTLFKYREGGRTVGSGRVATIIE